MLGIDAIKKAAKAVIRFGDKLEDALADGKITFVEGISLAISAAPDAFSLAQDAQQLKAEFNDLDSNERQELADYVTEELDLEADNVEEIAEKGFNLLVAIDELRVAIKHAK